MITNDSTKGLESMGRRLGMNITVRKIESVAHKKPNGHFYVVAADGLHLESPKLMGKSIRESELWIEEHAPKPKPLKDMVGSLCISKNCTGKFIVHKEDSDYVRCPKCHYVMARKQDSSTMLLASIISSQ